MSNQSAELYRRFASVCEAIAQETIDPTRKSLLGEMARYWKKLEHDESAHGTKQLRQHKRASASWRRSP